jgi:hypothetical protein
MTLLTGFNARKFGLLGLLLLFGTTWNALLEEMFSTPGACGLLFGDTVVEEDFEEDALPVGDFLKIFVSRAKGSGMGEGGGKASVIVLIGLACFLFGDLDKCRALEESISSLSLKEYMSSTFEFAVGVVGKNTEPLSITKGECTVGSL